MTGLVYLDIAIGVIFLLLVFSLFASAIMEAVAAVFNLKARSVRRAVRQLVGEAAFGGAHGIWKSDLIEALKGPSLIWKKERRDPSSIPSSTFRKAVLEKVGFDPLAPVSDFISGLKEKAADSLERRVYSALLGVEGHSASVQTAIDEWYESALARAEGWYVRRTQGVQFAIGLVLALATNTDPIGYAVELRNNDELRQEVVTLAQEVSALEDLDDVRKSLGIGGADDAETVADIRKAVGDLTNKLSGELDEIGATAGWEHCGKDCWLLCVWKTINPIGDNYEEVRNPLLGWILLAFGVMLGAQFWLDLLRRFVSIRSAATGMLGDDRQKPKNPDTTAG
ncbi:MAG: hypothetical protein AAF713_04155 [Pseudomonadota bacterium]